MAQWEPALGGSLFGKVFQPLAGIADAINSIISPLKTILSIIKTILKIIRAFIVDLASLLIAIIKTLVNEITKFLTELANSGIYILTLAPDFSSTQAFFDSTAGGFDGFVDKTYNKFFDVADAQRPIFPSDQQCGAVVLAVNSGNILGALNLLSLISNGFKNLFQQAYVPPVLKGSSGNGVNILYFERPNLPSNIFTSVRYEVQRSVTSGGKIKVDDMPKSEASKHSEKGESEPETTKEKVRNSQTSELLVEDYETIQVIDSGNAITGSSQYLIIDGNDEEAPQLVNFDLSQSANTIAVNLIRNPLVQTTSLGPNTFSLSQSTIKNKFSYSSVSTYDQITDSVISPDDAFAAKQIGNHWIDFRINGFSIPTTSGSGDMYVTGFDGSTITLSQNVPLGAKIKVFTYVQAKSSDVILLKDFYAKKNSLATAKFNVNDGEVVNDKTYFYRVVVTSDQQTTDQNGNTEYPALAKSNEIRLTPRANVTSNTMRAYCLGSKQGPFVITLDNNKLDFSVGSKRYQVALRPSILNSFSISSQDFNNKYGLVLDPKFKPATTNLVTTAINTGNASNQIVNALGGQSGLTFNYYGSDGRQHSVLPGGYIPRDAEEIILDLQSQCDHSARFYVKNGRIVIQDASNKASSLVIFHNENSALGFTRGTCMSTAYSTLPNWQRYAVKDFIPQIFDLAELIQSFANGLISSIESATKTLTDFIDLLAAKIQALEDFLTKVQNLLNALKNLKVLLPNLYILKVGPVGGATAVAKEIKNATNRPLSSPSDIAFGITIFVGGFATPIILPILKAIL